LFIKLVKKTIIKHSFVQNFEASPSGKSNV